MKQNKQKDRIAPIFLSFALRKSKNKQGIEPQAVLKYGKVKITQFTFDFRREELFNCAWLQTFFFQE